MEDPNVTSESQYDPGKTPVYPAPRYDPWETLSTWETQRISTDGAPWERRHTRRRAPKWAVVLIVVGALFLLFAGCVGALSYGGTFFEDSVTVNTGTTGNQCARFPGDQEGVSCTDVDYQVTSTDKDVDPWGLDGVAGMPGFGCESNPLEPVTGSFGTPWTYVLVGVLILISGVILYALVRRNRVTFRS